MNYIENISAIDCQAGNHMDPAPNTMLIQISDVGGWVPTPRYTFKEFHKFEFADIEVECNSSISNHQAEEIVGLLQHAIDNGMNVVVHCVAGICRSGAVVEVGVMMGFAECENYRQPNCLVKHKLMKVLGWTYGEERDGKIYSGE